MKPLIAAVALSLACAVQSLAKEEGQRSADPKSQAAWEAERISTFLRLDEAQSKKVADIIAKNAEEKAALEKKLRDHERRTHEAVRAVLSDEQKESFDMMRARRVMGHMGGMGHAGGGMGRMGGGGGPGGMGGGPGRMMGGKGPRRGHGPEGEPGEPGGPGGQGGPQGPGRGPDEGPQGPPPGDE
jgi:hypothetical protein